MHIKRYGTWCGTTVAAMRQASRRRRHRRIAARIDRVTLGEHIAYWRARLGGYR